MSDPVVLLTTDLHLSERNDEQYRFGIFDWMKNNYQGKVSAVFIAGDLTDRKNYHADWFVNKVSSNIRRLARSFPVFILKGNHDYDANPTGPFFEFLGNYNRVRYVSEPELLDVSLKGAGAKVLMLPHTHNRVRDWGILEWKGMEPDFILMHQTFKGAKAESGIELDGVDPRMLAGFDCPIFSGDIHVPQKVKNITYIGCPYHIHYGDGFEPRVILLDEKFRVSTTHFPAPKKIVVDVTSSAELKSYHNRHSRQGFTENDWLKVRIHLPRGEFGSWESQRDKIRTMTKKWGVRLHSVVLKELKRESNPRRRKLSRVSNRRSRLETFNAYCERYSIDHELVEAGLAFMEE